VLGGELGADQERGAEGCDLGQGLVARPEREGDCQDGDEDDDPGPQRLEAIHLPPDAEGGVAVGLVGDRAVPESRQTRFDQRPKHHQNGNSRKRKDEPHGRGSCHG